MCDSFVALPSVVKGSYTIFGKVSDRAVNEPQYFVHIPAADHNRGEKLKCTFTEIEQAPHTYEMILSKPSWIWGAEIGVNEFGVCAGNETVYSKEYRKEPALMGMDIVRIALERSKTAREALDTATAILEKYGQGGNCSFDAEFYYDNSFLFADAEKAWVLETSGRYWAAKEVKGAWSISNYMSIGAPDLMHKDAVRHAEESGYCVKEPFDFAAAFIDWEHKGNHNGMVRKISSQRLLDEAKPEITIRDAIAVMQSHTSDDPFHSGNFSVCKHATGSDGQHHSANSMAVEIRTEETVLWIAGRSLPCCSLYKPVWFDAYGCNQVYEYTLQQEAMEEWIKREWLNREIAAGKIDEAEYKHELKCLQESVFERFGQLKREERLAFCEEIAREEENFVNLWLQKAKEKEEDWKGNDSYKRFWRHYNAQLGRNKTIFY